MYNRGCIDRRCRSPDTGGSVRTLAARSAARRGTEGPFQVGRHQLAEGGRAGARRMTARTAPAAGRTLQSVPGARTGAACARGGEVRPDSDARLQAAEQFGGPGLRGAAQCLFIRIGPRELEPCVCARSNARAPSGAGSSAGACRAVSRRERDGCRGRRGRRAPPHIGRHCAHIARFGNRQAQAERQLVIIVRVRYPRACAGEYACCHGGECRQGEDAGPDGAGAARAWSCARGPAMQRASWSTRREAG
jgi:hypothetical protein